MSDDNITKKTLKEWEYNGIDYELIEVTVPDLDFPLIFESGVDVVCKNRPKEIAYSEVAPENYDLDLKAWHVGDQRVAAGGDYFATIVRVIDEIESETDKINHKYIVETYAHENIGYRDKIELVFWNQDVDLDNGDEVYIETIQADKFKNQLYLSVSDDSRVVELNNTSFEDVINTIKSISSSI